VLPSLGLGPGGKQRRKRYDHRHKLYSSKLLRPSSEFCLLLSFSDQMDKVELRMGPTKILATLWLPVSSRQARYWVG
jgi:hypothetical protein